MIRVMPGRDRIRAVLAALCGTAVGALGGCSQPKVEADIDSDVPQERLMGLAESVRANDRSAARAYVEMLESQDPAVRMFAIGALERMTGETKGYDFAAPERERAAAVAAWAAWAESGAAATASR